MVNGNTNGEKVSRGHIALTKCVKFVIGNNYFLLKVQLSFKSVVSKHDWTSQSPMKFFKNHRFYVPNQYPIFWTLQPESYCLHKIYQSFVNYWVFLNLLFLFFYRIIFWLCWIIFLFFFLSFFGFIFLHFSNFLAH